MDPDREAIEKAVRAWCSGTGKDLVSTVVDSVIAHLARLEGEKPKKASLGELVEHLSFDPALTKPPCCGCADYGTFCCDKRRTVLREAAAALRSVVEFQREYAAVVTERDADKIGEKLYRSLP